jgi:hypothetical protein
MAQVLPRTLATYITQAPRPADIASRCAGGGRFHLRFFYWGFGTKIGASTLHLIFIFLCTSDIFIF